MSVDIFAFVRESSEALLLVLTKRVRFPIFVALASGT